MATLIRVLNSLEAVSTPGRSSKAVEEVAEPIGVLKIMDRLAAVSDARLCPVAALRTKRLTPELVVY